MITIKSTSYRKEDVIFVTGVIDRGLCGCCEKYSTYHDKNKIDCERCVNKTACTDLQSAYHYMIAKMLRMEADEEIELPDS